MQTIAEEGEEETLKPERTPASSAKRFMLSSLFAATPATLRYAAMAEDQDNTKLAGKGTQGNNNATAQEAVDSGTPSFLRRSSSGRYPSGATDGFSPTAVRKPRPVVRRGLSAIVQDLRDMEEERLQEDTDVLHEIEAEMAAANAQVGDSQDPANNAGPPRKKKGQKRTTRRVTMRPVVVPKSRREFPKEELHNESGDEETGVPETQLPDAAGRDHGERPDGIDDAASLHTTSEPELEYPDPDYAEPSGTKSKSFSERIKEAVSSVAKPQSKFRPQKGSLATAAAKEEKKPCVRKVNPEAHANYRALKIRNKGTKGRFARRFGRR